MTSLILYGSLGRGGDRVHAPGELAGVGLVAMCQASIRLDPNNGIDYLDGIKRWCRKDACDRIIQAERARQEPHRFAPKPQSSGSGS